MLGDGRVVEDELGACAKRVDGANWDTGALLDGALIRGEDEYDFAYDGALRNPLDGALPRYDDIRGEEENDLELDGALRMALGAEPPR